MERLYHLSYITYISQTAKRIIIDARNWVTHKLFNIRWKYYSTYFVTSHAFTSPPSEFGRDVVIISYHGRSFSFIAISGARLGVASERISQGWVNGSSNDRVGMRHEFGFQFGFRQLSY